MREASALGRTAWNAYAFNVSYRTGDHFTSAVCQFNMLSLPHRPQHSATGIFQHGIAFNTGPHVDGKNVAGSYSALMVCEVGDPVAGGFYMLPQFRAALDVRQGVCNERLAAVLHKRQRRHAASTPSKGLCPRRLMAIVWDCLAHQHNPSCCRIILLHTLYDPTVCSPSWHLQTHMYTKEVWCPTACHLLTEYSWHPQNLCDRAPVHLQGW